MSAIEEMKTALTAAAIRAESLEERRNLRLTRDFILAITENFDRPGAIDKHGASTKEVVQTTINAFASAFVICFAPYFKAPSFKEKSVDEIAAVIAAHIEAYLVIKLKSFDECRTK